jgi:hypothetical protein
VSILFHMFKEDAKTLRCTGGGGGLVQ